MTIRTWGRLAVITLAVVLVQVCVLNQIVVGGAHPDALLLLAISAGLVAGPQRGAVMGFALGLVADVFVPTPYGLSSLCYVLVAFAVGLASGAATTRPTFGFQATTAAAGRGGRDIALRRARNSLGQPSLPHHQLVVAADLLAAGCVLFANPAYRLVEWTLAVVPGARRDTGGFASGGARSAVGQRSRAAGAAPTSPQAPRPAPLALHTRSCPHPSAQARAGPVLPGRRRSREAQEHGSSARARSSASRRGARAAAGRASARFGVRLTVIGLVVLVAFSAVVVRLWSLQVLHSSHYRNAALVFEQQTVPITPRRRPDNCPRRTGPRG